MIVKPEEAGMSPERLERITRHFESRYLQPGKIAGCQILVWRKGHTAYFRTFGLADRERERPMRHDTIFRIYSMTKPITSVALMALFEEGHFQLGDPVSRFLPEFRDLQVYESGDRAQGFKTRPCERPMSVRDALMHMTGVASGFASPDPIDRAYAEQRVRTGKGATLQTLIETLATLPLKFSPGTRWSYGLSTDICARLVEVISGQRFDAFLAERIFSPLGMVDTGFTIPEKKRERFAANYRRGPGKDLLLVDDSEQSVYRNEPTYFSGAGGLISTSADYLRFCQMLMRGGELEGNRILGRKTIELMVQNHLPGGADLGSLAMGGFGETAFEGVGFGLGFAVTLGDAPAQSIGARGDYYWGGAASTIFWIDPVERLCVIFMTQLMPSQTFNFRGQLRNLVYSSIIDAS
jgi:CubicO group peptidase (beta-lactamase class C family)